MLPKNELARILDTVLSIPGMNETVKIAVRIPRRNVLLLSQVIERGLNEGEEENASTSILDIASPSTLQELSTLSADLLQKAGLTEVYEKLKAL